MSHDLTFKIAELKNSKDGEPKVATYTIDSFVAKIAKASKSATLYDAYHYQKKQEKALNAEARLLKSSGDNASANAKKLEAKQFKLYQSRTKDGKAVMPFVFKDDVTFKIVTDDWKQRDNTQITHFSIVMLDIESHIAKDEIHTALSEYEYVLWPTVSHRPDDPRFRVVLFPTAALTLLDADALIRRIDAHLPDRNAPEKKVQAIDAASLDVGRLMFLPMWLSGHPEKYFYVHNHGKLVDASSFPLSEEQQRLVDARSQKAEAEKESSAVQWKTVARSDNSALIEKNGVTWLNPDGELETDAGWVRIADITKKITVSCPGHFDTTGSEFAGPNNFSKRPQLVCKHCGTIKMWPGSTTTTPDEDDTLVIPTKWRKSKRAALKPAFEAADKLTCLTVCDRYLDSTLSQHIPQQGIMLVKSPKGTGKTQMLEKLKDEREKKGERTLLLGHRVYLLQALADRTGLDYYRDLKDGTLSDDVALCMNSLTRINPATDEPYDTVIIDESEQVFRHLASKTLTRDLSKVFASLIWVIRNARRIICLDADLSPELTVEVLKEMRGPQFETDEALTVINEHQIGEGRTTKVYLDKYHLIHDAMVDIDEGHKVFIATNSRALANTLSAAASVLGKKSLLITAETNEQPDTTAFIKDPKGESVKYDVVVASPTLSTGVSIEGGHFTKVYGIFGRSPGTFQDADQALSRVRGCVADAVWLQPNRTVPVLDSELNIYHAYIEKEQKSLIKLVGEAVPLTEGQRLWTCIRARLEVVDRRDMAYKLRDFQALRRGLGYSLETVLPSSGASSLGRELVSAFKVIDANRGAAVFHAKDIDVDTFTALTRKRQRSSDEQLQVERFKYKHLLSPLPEGFSVETVTKAVDQDLLRVIGKLRVLVAATDDDRTRMDLSDRAKNVNTYTINPHRVMQEELLSWLGKKAGVDYEALLKRHSETVEIEVSTLQAVAAAFAERAKDFNYFFSARIKDATSEQNLKAIWEAVFGGLGLHLVKKRQGPRDNRVMRYFLDSERSDLTLKAFEAEQAAPQGRTKPSPIVRPSLKL